MAIGNPRGIADDDIGPAASGGEGERPGKVARDIGPDRVAVFAAQLVEGDIGLAEIADGVGLFLGEIGLVVLLRDAL